MLGCQWLLSKNKAKCSITLHLANNEFLEFQKHFPWRIEKSLKDN